MNVHDQDAFQQAQDEHYRFLMGSFITEVEESEDGLFVASDILDSSYWNYLASPTFAPESVSSFKDRLVAHFQLRQRVPCLQIDSDSSSELSRNLLGCGFSKAYEEVWMFHDGSKGDMELVPETTFSLCECNEDLEVFLEVFFSAYSGTSPDEPYGALGPEYGVAFERAFELRDERGLKFVVMFWKDKPVASAEIGLNNGVACLYGLGVKPEYRKHGFGRCLTQHRISMARDHGAELIFLQTEAGSYNERLFETFGFQKRASYTGYVI